MKKVFNVYGDAGHAWCKVPFRLLIELDIAKKITAYSYVKGDYVYLEEDCDLSTFIIAYRKAHNIDPVFRDFIGSRESRIRGYAHYNYQKILADIIYNRMRSEQDDLDKLGLITCFGSQSANTEQV